MPRSRMQTSTVFKQLIRGHSTLTVFTRIGILWLRLLLRLYVGWRSRKRSEVLDQRLTIYFNNGTKKFVTRCGEIYIYMWWLYWRTNVLICAKEVYFGILFFSLNYCSPISKNAQLYITYLFVLCTFVTFLYDTKITDHPQTFLICICIYMYSNFFATIVHFPNTPYADNGCGKSNYFISFRDIYSLNHKQVHK